MSWFSDIAGKAEHFLNKVDQGAASALQSEKQFKTYNRNPVIETYIEPSINGESKVSTNFNSVRVNQQPKVDKYATVPKKQIYKNKGKRNNHEDDEKLLEFLNDSNAITNKMEAKCEKIVEHSSNENNTHSAQIDSVNSSKANNGVKSEKIIRENKLKLSEKVDSVGSETSKPNDETKSINNTDDDISGTVNQLSSAASSIELENKFLKKEIASLNQEIGSVLKRAKDAETESKGLRSKIEAQNSKIFGTEKKIKDLQGKESDFSEVLRAKDSQTAVLRVRIEESDQKLRAKEKMYEMLKTQNDRLLKEHSDSSGLQNQALDALKLRLTDTENALKLERESLKCATKDASDRLNKLEEERRNMALSMNHLERQLTDEKAKSNELSENCRTMKISLDQTVMELNEYKQKAQRILQTKEKLIANLKDEKSVPGDSTFDVTASIIEQEELRREKDGLRDELNHSVIKVKNLQSEISEVESTFQNEIDMMQKQINANEEQIFQNQQLQKELDQENSQLKQELSYLREDMTKNKTNLQSRLKDRDLEIEKLRKQVTARAINNSTEAELEARVHSLTESLIHKQTILEAMSTEKNSLTLQLERLENEMKESQSYSKQSHSVGINEADEVKARVPVFLRESPFDGDITRKVKRVYNSIDIFSVRVGIFLRKYPIARVFILIYMLLLHLWVLIILITYTPESHSSDYNPQPPSSNN